MAPGLQTGPLIRGKKGVVLQTWVLHFSLSCTENNESHRDYEFFRESIMKPCLDASNSYLSQTTSDVQIDNICVS